MYSCTDYIYAKTLGKCEEALRTENKAKQRAMQSKAEQNQTKLYCTGTGTGTGTDTGTMEITKTGAKSHFLGTVFMCIAYCRRQDSQIVVNRQQISHNPKSPNTFLIFLYLSGGLFFCSASIFPHLIFL